MLAHDKGGWVSDFHSGCHSGTRAPTRERGSEAGERAVVHDQDGKVMVVVVMTGAVGDLEQSSQ